MTYKRIRIRATGQVTEMVPDVARAMISSGMAEDLTPAGTRPDSMQTQPAERAMKPAAKPRRVFSRNS